MYVEKSVPSRWLESLREYLTSEFRVRNTLGNSVFSHGTMNLVRLDGDDNNDYIDIRLIPCKRSVKVDNEKPKKVQAAAVVSTEDQESTKYWYFPSDIVNDIKELPELRQAFYEAESYAERDADYRYHFSDSSTKVAESAPSPTERPDKSYTVVAAEQFNQFPQEWLLETDKGDGLYLRERSGSIRLYEGYSREEENEIFNVYIGSEHPGMNLKPNEVLNIVSGVEYVSLTENTQDTVSEEIWEERNENLRQLLEEIEDDIGYYEEHEDELDELFYDD